MYLYERLSLRAVRFNWQPPGRPDAVHPFILPTRQQFTNLPIISTVLGVNYRNRKNGVVTRWVGAHTHNTEERSVSEARPKQLFYMGIITQRRKPVIICHEYHLDLTFFYSFWATSFRYIWIIQILLQKCKYGKIFRGTGVCYVRY